MSWIGNLYSTYEACRDVVGVSKEENQEKMLLPIGHILMEPDIIVRLNSDGTFLEYEQPSKYKDKKFLICAPCTEDSASRSSTGARNFPHPLFDQIKYLSSEVYAKKLQQWLGYLQNKPQYALSFQMLTAVARYLQKPTLKADLDNPKENAQVVFRVSIPNILEDRLWCLPELREAWIVNLKSLLSDQQHSEDVCYISGERLPITEKHPKSINRVAGNAKLISGNDSHNYTYRGRFAKSSQALTVSYIASQKAHQALRWLIATRGYRCDTQAIVAWAIDSKIDITSFHADSYGIYEEEAKSESELLIKVDNTTAIDYAKLLTATLFGAGNAERLQKYGRRIAILATDAATTGRLSVTYYREFSESEYWERLIHWHNTCKWFQPYTWENEGEYLYGYFIGAPSVDRIVETVLGKRRPGRDESYDKLKKGVRERLVHCIMDGERIPVDILNSALHRASHPLSLENKDAKTAAVRWRNWEQVLCAACALYRRHYYEKNKEGYNMTLDETCRNRDYLYGRLLAIADALENGARYKQGKVKDDPRPTNALRYMNAFSQHPFRTWKVLWEQLNPYIQQLNGAGRYLNQIEEVKLLFHDEEYVSDSPLNGRYLLGFFAQRHELRFKSN